jgi:hypothetical protein
VNPTEGVLGEAWDFYKRHWRHLLPIAFVVYLAVALVSLLLVAVLTWLGAIIAVVISLVATFWVQGALVKAVDDVRDGRADMSLGETFQAVRPQLSAIVVAGILAGLAIAIGLVLLIVPGLVLLTWWILIIPVIVLERSRAGEAFTRSRELVRGHGWSVFGVIVLTILLFIAFRIVLGLVLIPFADWIQSFLTEIVTGTLATPFVAVAWTLLYYRLRGVKEQPATPAPETT